MQFFENILQTIGNTPLIKLNDIVKDLPCTVLAKYETFNPGNSVKDRIALKMIDDAEKKGLLKPGGTIIEGTSGNTGMGLAIVAINKGYKCIFVASDKQSKGKLNALRVFGAKVIVCPTDVDAEDERSYYSVSKKLSEEIPNSWYVNQYDNPSNTKAHYESTGPEIWKQTEGKITHFVVGVGTGGSISGIGKYLKEMNPNIKVWGVDAYGSVLKKFHETGIFDKDEIYPYKTEGIGEDMIPENIDFDIDDDWCQGHKDVWMDPKDSDKTYIESLHKNFPSETEPVQASAHHAVRGPSLWSIRAHRHRTQASSVACHDAALTCLRSEYSCTRLAQPVPPPPHR